MPITISYGNPALVGAASFAIGRERGKLKAGAQAARMAQGMLDRRDRSMERERDRNDRLGVLGAQMQQRERMNQQGLIGDERNRQQRGQIEQARLAQRDADRAANQGRYDQGRIDDATKRQQKRDYDQWLQRKQAYDIWKNAPDSATFPRGPAPPDPGPPPTIPTPSGGGSPVQTLPGAPVDPISGGSQPYVPMQSANPLGGRGQQGRDDRTLTINEMYASGAAPNDSGFFLGTDKRNWAHTQKGPNQYLQDLGGGVYRRRTRRPGSAGYVEPGQGQQVAPGMVAGQGAQIPMAGGTASPGFDDPGQDFDIMPDQIQPSIAEPYSRIGGLAYDAPTEGYSDSQKQEMNKLYDALGKADSQLHLSPEQRENTKQQIRDRLASMEKNEIPPSLRQESTAAQIAKKMLNFDQFQNHPLTISDDGTIQSVAGIQPTVPMQDKLADARIEIIKDGMKQAATGPDGASAPPDPDQVSANADRALAASDEEKFKGWDTDPDSGARIGPEMGLGEATSKALGFNAGDIYRADVVPGSQPGRYRVAAARRATRQTQTKAEKPKPSNRERFKTWLKDHDLTGDDYIEVGPKGSTGKLLPRETRLKMALETWRQEEALLATLDEENDELTEGVQSADGTSVQEAPIWQGGGFDGGLASGVGGALLEQPKSNEAPAWQGGGGSSAVDQFRDRGMLPSQPAQPAQQPVGAGVKSMQGIPTVEKALDPTRFHEAYWDTVTDFAKGVSLPFKSDEEEVKEVSGGKAVQDDPLPFHKQRELNGIEDRNRGKADKKEVTDEDLEAYARLKGWK